MDHARRISPTCLRVHESHESLQLLMVAMGKRICQPHQDHLALNIALPGLPQKDSMPAFTPILSGADRVAYGSIRLDPQLHRQAPWTVAREIHGLMNVTLVARKQTRARRSF